MVSIAYAILRERVRTAKSSARLLANIAPSLEIIPGLTYRLNFGIDYSTTNRDIQLRPYALLEGLELGSLTTLTTLNENQLVEHTLTYNLDLDKHNATFLVGHSYQKTFVRQKAFSLRGVADNDVKPQFQDQTSHRLLWGPST